MTVARTALVLAPPAGDRRWVTGLGLGERGRRVAVRAGFSADRIVVVRDAAELRDARDRLTGPLVLLRATDQVVAVPLVEPLGLAEPGDRHAVDPARGGGYAGARVVDDGAALVDALVADFAAGDAPGATSQPVEIGERARFPVRDRAEEKAANAWQWELVNKAMDAPITRYFYRPLARPLTHLFLRTPLSPNVISLISIALSLAGCAIAASADPDWHVIGLAILVAGGITDCNDGEVARLRLQMSKSGAWLDAMGDDAARLALVAGIGLHVDHLHPDWHALAITGASLAMTVAALLLIYWYCIFVINSSNNQDYTRALQIGPGVRPEGKRTIWQVASDWGAQIIRRDFIDLGVLVLAIFHVSEVSFVMLTLGAVVTLGVVIPTHLKIVKGLRTGALTRAPR